MIEKIVIDEPMGQKEKNYGKRIVDIYIYELGNLSELVDVRFKPYSQRIKEIAPQLLLERRCDTANVIDMSNMFCRCESLTKVGRESPRF